VFILFQNKNTVRSFLNTIDKTVGIPLIEKSYALDDCNDLSFANLWDQLDFFVLVFLLFQLICRRMLWVGSAKLLFSVTTGFAGSIRSRLN
jgi:hypothetical protein